MIRSAVLTQITGATSNSDGPDSDGPGFDGSPEHSYIGLQISRNAI